MAKIDEEKGSICERRAGVHIRENEFIMNAVTYSSSADKTVDFRDRLVPAALLLAGNRSLL